MILGAATREIAADVALAVHSAKVTVNFRGAGVPPPALMVALANLTAHDRSDHMIAAYLTKMGADTAALLALVRTVKFEQMHVLTREEIVRFGIDRREFVETPWMFEPGVRAMVHKIVLQRRAGESTFRTTQWRMICLDRERFELDFMRPATADSLQSKVSISTGGAWYFLLHAQSQLQAFEVWGIRMPKALIRSLSEASKTELAETFPAADGQKNLLTQELSNEGFADGLNRLASTCPAPKGLPQTVEVRDQLAK